MKNSFKILTVIIVIFTFHCSTAQKSQQPNIILIYADDLGYSDIAVNAREYRESLVETPKIDQLAAEGMRFTNAYSAAPICSASRAAILTGKSPARLGYEFVTMSEGSHFRWDDPMWLERFENKPLISPPYNITLPLKEITIPVALKKYGYRTGMVGKWHVAPFFLYVSHYYDHTPLGNNVEWLIRKYLKKFDGKISREQARYAPFVDLFDLKIESKLSEDFDGVSLVSFLQGKPNGSLPETRFCQWNRYKPFYSHNAAVRIEEWKLIRPSSEALLEYSHDIDSESKMAPDLYDLSSYPDESNNVSNLYPEKVSEMLKMLKEWSDSVEKDRIENSNFINGELKPSIQTS